MSLRLDGCCVTYLDDGARVSALEDLSLDVPDGRAGGRQSRWGVV